MLPDYPNLKKKLKNLLIAHMKKIQSGYSYPLSKIPKTRIFEGNKFIIVHDDGTEEEAKVKRMKAEMKITLKEIEAKKPQIILDKIYAAAKEIAIQQSKIFYKQIEKAVEKVGNVIDVGGRPFSINDLFKMFEKLQLDFDENGRPYLPTFICREKAYESISEVLPQLDTDPECKKRFAEIIAKKKEEWRAREINRKLVG